MSILASATTGNTSFSAIWPGLQLAVDSTSLGAFKECPRKYFYSILLGWQPKAENVHLRFGLLIHGSIERYHHARASGEAHDASLSRCVRWALSETWDREISRAWASGDPNKNRFTLIRSLVWYLDQYGANDALQTVIKADGKPAVELSFSFDSGLASALTGERFVLCGHLDREALMNGVAYIPDCKTTKHQLDQRYWAQFNPSNQFGMYDLAGAVALPQPAQGMIVDAMQILVKETRFARQLIRRDEAQREEWLGATQAWLKRMEECARAGGELEARGQSPEAGWPMNETSCDKYAGCQFREVCQRSPAARPQWLAANFAKRVWDPLERRGDV